jgi:hypothetical protein
MFCEEVPLMGPPFPGLLRLRVTTKVTTAAITAPMPMMPTIRTMAPIEESPFSFSGCFAVVSLFPGASAASWIRPSGD